MLLHTPLYLAFLAGVCVVYWLLPGQRARKWFLLAASYFFYALFDWRLAALLLGLTLSAFLIGRALPASPQPRRLAWLSVAVNLGVLGAFKYAGFFLSSLARVAGALPPAFQLLLPMGLSFYTFQAIAYTTEIYRGRLAPAAFVDCALLLAFFPKLIAGPFTRPAQFLQQLREPAPALRSEAALAAAGLLLLGLFKKVVIADGLAALADVSFRAAALPPGPQAFPAPLYWRGFYLYAFQIYADFSGYTDIARASAALLGFALPGNFLRPYFALTPGDFWNRWHMSLTHWFREYLFFPLSRALLGFTRRRYERAVQAAVTLVTMILIGLWHGAGWTFAAWGAWHGLLLALDRLLGWKPHTRWQQAVSAGVTFHLVGLGWVLFGSESPAAAGRFLAGLFSLNQLATLPLFVFPVLAAGALVFGIDLAAARRWLERWPGWRAALAAAAVVVILSLWLLRFAGGAQARPFIYGRF
jgi:D-alanyl-lipoteichoic acid acyltransferase DltB (MBOAT superfamily)